MARLHTLALTALLGLGLGAATIVSSGCEPAVSDDATITISGMVLDEDGAPLEGAVVRLWKSDLDLLDWDVATGWAIATGTPFREVETDSTGAYSITLTGADANTSGGNFAAYFSLTTSRGASDMQSVATSSYQFSNQNLAWSVPDMQYWDDVSVDTTDPDLLQFSWTAAPGAADTDRYHIAVDGGVWFDAVNATSFDLSTLALPGEGTGSESFHVMRLDGDLRYRSAVHSFEATNPRGPGLDYQQVDNNSISATDCEGLNLFDLNDGDFTGVEGVEDFADSTQDGARCLTITLQAEEELTDILVQNAAVFDSADAQIEYAYRSSEDEDFTVFATQDAHHTEFWNYNDHLSDQSISALQLRLSIIGSDDAYFAQIGEITLYATELDR